ncbi:MAG: DUF2110 family protein [Candidatus Bathyarchaeota archaeon]|nr:MAG: DUF2110 family protein [Candidatus Bathyarchaeota archaeon]
MIILEKIYGHQQAFFQKVFAQRLASQFTGIDAHTKVTHDRSRNWIQVEITGSDLTVATHYLERRYGIAPEFSALQLPDVLRGKIIDSGKVGYGLYVDVGFISQKPIDVLVSLHSLRSQLTDGKKISLKKIINLFCLHNNLPFKVRITNVDKKKNQVWADLADEQTNRFRRWLTMHADRVIVLGANLEQIQHAISASNLQRDVVKIDELGFLEHSLLCKLGTDAPGIIKTIGQQLPKIPLYTFSPRKIIKTIGKLYPLTKHS